MHWEHNQKGWMTAAIFVKYLHWLNNHVAGCNVVLLVDEFSAHMLGLRLVQESGGLDNVNVKYYEIKTCNNILTII